MAKKSKIDEILFCDRCGGSIPTGAKPFVVEKPDGTTKSLCQECTWAARSEEEQPTVALDDDIAVDAEALQSIRRPEGVPEAEPMALVEEEPEEGEMFGGPAAGAVVLRHCKTFVSLASGQALDFLDQHIAAYIRERKLRVKQASTCYGMAGIGPQGSRVDAIFITVWW